MDVRFLATTADGIATIARDLNRQMSGLDQLVKTFTLEEPTRLRDGRMPVREPHY